MFPENNSQKQALEVLNQLTLEEKIDLLHGRFLSGGVPRLNIPQLLCADGPLGVRMMTDITDKSGTNDEVEANTALESDVIPTALPATIGLAATFNTKTAYEYGALLGRECAYLGVNVLFGPGLNVMRDPRCGRNYEYLSEDPILTGEIGCAYVEGLQNTGVAACAKHYYANDEEPVRHFASSNLDDEVGREIYVRPFLMAARKARLWTMMTGNHLINGKHASENKEALSIMRDDAEWDGVVFTDWRAAYYPETACEAGLDMTTGFCEYVYGDGRLLELVKSGKIPESSIDEKALHVLSLYCRVGLIGKKSKASGELATAKHKEIAKNIAAESMVLVKNDEGTLPLSVQATSKLVFTGPSAKIVLAGTGSANVYNGHEDLTSITPLAGILEAFADYDVSFVESVEKATDTKADAIIYCACTNAPGEGKDMKTIKLSKEQEADIIKLGEVSSRLIVVVQCGSAIDMSSWIDSTDAVIVAWLGGVMTGTALGEILMGKTNPSGKLPCTFGKSIDDYPCEKLGLWPAKLILDSPPSSPGATADDREAIHGYDCDYDEGFLVGYRWFDKKEIQPLFPFGYGLSYTTFELSNPQISFNNNILHVECEVENTGNRHGGEVVQVYLSSPLQSSKRPIKEFKGCAKVFLDAGEKKKAMIEISDEELKCYDSSKSIWYLPEGDYEILIGTSSRDINFKEKICL